MYCFKSQEMEFNNYDLHGPEYHPNTIFIVTPITTIAWTGVGLVKPQGTLPQC